MRIVIDENAPAAGTADVEAETSDADSRDDEDEEHDDRDECCTCEDISVVFGMVSVLFFVFFFAVLPILPQFMKKSAIHDINEANSISKETRKILQELNPFVSLAMSTLGSDISSRPDFTQEDVTSQNFNLGWVQNNDATSTPYGWDLAEIYFEESDSRDPSTSLLLQTRTITESFQYDIIKENDLFGLTDNDELGQILTNAQLLPLRDNFHFITDEDTLATYLEDLRLLPLGRYNGYLLPIPYHEWEGMTSDEAISRIFWYGIGSVLIMGPEFTELYGEAVDAAITPTSNTLGDVTPSSTINQHSDLYNAASNRPNSFQEVPQGEGNQQRPSNRHRSTYELERPQAKDITVNSVESQQPNSVQTGPQKETQPQDSNEYLSAFYLPGSNQEEPRPQESPQYPLAFHKPGSAQDKPQPQENSGYSSAVHQPDSVQEQPRPQESSQFPLASNKPGSVKEPKPQDSNQYFSAVYEPGSMQEEPQSQESSQFPLAFSKPGSVQEEFQPQESNEYLSAVYEPGSSQEKPLPQESSQFPLAFHIPGSVQEEPQPQESAQYPLAFHKPGSVQQETRPQENSAYSSALHQSGSVQEETQPQKSAAYATNSVYQPTQATTSETINRNIIGYEIDLDVSSLRVRSGYRPYGFRINFDTNQKLVSIYDPEQDKVLTPNDGVEWERAKYLVKHTVETIITTREHLQWSHLIASNTLARANAMQLPPNHPLRRLISVFTFNANGVNADAEALLIPEYGWIHRMTSLQYSSLLEMFDAGVTKCNIFQPFKDIDLSNKPGLQSLIEAGKFPYYSEGLLFYNVVHNFVTNWFEFSSVDAMSDQYAQAFYQDLVSSSKGQAYEVPDEFSLDKLIDSVAQLIWVVTAYHELVGTTVEYLTHPSRMGFRPVASNKGDGNMVIADTESFTLGALFSALAGVRMPSLVGSFSDYFGKDGAPEWEISVWESFQADIVAQGDAVKAADEVRVANGQPEFKMMDPTRFQCSVSV